MSLKKAVLWAKLKSPFSRAENSQKELRNSLSSKLNVNEEYTKAFRTESYVEMYSKVQCQLERKSFEFDRPNLSTSSLSTSLPSSFSKHLSDYLLEPQQDTLMNIIQDLQFHRLLIDFFDASLEAYNICESLLCSVRQTRANHRKLQKVIKLKNRSSRDSSRADMIIFRHLTVFASLKNPLSIVTAEELLNYNDNNMLLLNKLASKGRKIRRKSKFNKIVKKIGGLTLAVSNTAIIVIMLVFLLHSVVGIVAAPGLMAPCLVLLKKGMKVARGRGGGSGGRQDRVQTSLLERFAAQIDLAAKGMYILVNDLNTMSRMVKRLHDEVEHHKSVAKMCVRNGKTEILKEVVKEIEVHESRFVEQLTELEDHIYLCFLTINRSRRLVLEEIMASQENLPNSK